MNVQLDETWRADHRGAVVGFLELHGAENPAHSDVLTEHVRRVEAALRDELRGATREALARLPELEAYRTYYRRYEKTYHVLLQLESVVLKGKPLRSNGALVLAMFAAELRSRLLTAGHDLDAVAGGITVGSAAGDERYTGLGGRELTLRSGDMFMRDDAGVISSVLYGPDDRTQIRAGTRRAIFCVYGPAGIRPEWVDAHLDDIAGNARRVAPAATVAQKVVLTA